MSVSVIRNGVAARDNLRGDLRKLTDTPANHEKCRARAVLVQQIQQPGCCRWIRAIVECKGDRAGIARSPQRRTEQLRGRNERAPRPHCRERRCRPGNRRCYRGWIHILNFRTRRAPASAGDSGPRF